MTSPQTDLIAPAERPSTANLDVELYWQLPTPSEWLQSVTRAVERDRVVVARIHGLFAPPLPSTPHGWRSRLPGHWLEPLLLRCGKLTRLAATVKLAVDEADGVAGARINNDDEGGPRAGAAGAIRAVVVACDEGQVATDVVAPYAAYFLANHARDALRLLVIQHDYALGTEHPRPNWPPEACVLDFDGRLSGAQLQAYVQMRALRMKPSELGSLRESLAVEFAGFDVLFAQHLLDQSDDTLVGLPATLPRVASRYWVHHDRWSQANDDNQSVYAEGASLTVHALRAWALAISGGHEAELARHDLDMKLWRACTRALMPVLETIRQRSLEVLGARLASLRGPRGYERPRGEGKYFPVRELHELECSDIVIFQRRHAAYFLNCSAAEDDALRGCERAKAVRDCLAHFESPSRELVQDLLSSARRLS